MAEDRYRPSEATPSGQMIRFTESLGRSKHGRVVATVILAALIVFVLLVVYGVVSSVTSSAP